MIFVLEWSIKAYGVLGPATSVASAPFSICLQVVLAASRDPPSSSVTAPDVLLSLFGHYLKFQCLLCYPAVFVFLGVKKVTKLKSISLDTPLYKL